VVEQALDGLRSVLANPAGVAQGLAQRAQALLPGVVRTVVGLVRDAVQRAIPEGPVAGLLGGLVEEVAGFLGDPSRWQALQRDGLGFLLSRLVPIARDFALSMLGRLPGSASGVVRGVVESLLGAVTRLLSNPASIASFAQNAVAQLVSLGVNAIGPAVVGLVERAGAGAAVVGGVRSIFDELAAALAEPARLQQFLRTTPAQAFQRVLGKAKEIVEALIGDVVKDAGLKTLAQEGAKAVLDFVERAAAGGGNLGEAAKAVLARFIPAVAGLAKEKLLGLFPHSLAGLKTVLGRGFDKLTSFATGLVQTGQAAWRELVGDGSRLFGDLVGAVLPLVKEPVMKAVSWTPLQGLLGRLLDEVAGLLADPAKLIREFGNAQTAMRALLPRLEKVIGPFAQDVLVKPLPRGLPQDVVKALVDGGLSFLKEPQKLEQFLQRVRNANDAKVIIREILAGVVPGLLGSLPGGRGGALYTVFCNGLDYMMSNLLGGTVGQLGCSGAPPRTASR
jgi:hypothetical protein